MARVLLDSWTFEQYLIDPKGISPRALKALEAAESDGQLYVSIISYLIVRDRAKQAGVPNEKLRDLDVRMTSVKVLSLDPNAVASMDKIPFGADFLDRVVAAVAMVENHTLLTQTTAVCCPGLDFIISSPPAIDAK